MAALIQRPLRGSRISTFYPVKNLPSLSSLDSAFQLQEYISLLIRLDVHDVDAIISLPGTSSREKDSTSEQEKAEPSEGAKDGEKDTEKGKNDVTVDEACWIYEQLRRLAQDLSHPLITTLQQECTRASCPEMKAGEWLYLCVAHGNDGAMEQCCAIDYILHTVDSATALLNSPRTFPSRLSIPQTSHRHFSSLARRLGRIFAHAYFHHREAFEQAEAESSLYARFLALTAKFDLVPAEFLVIPSAQFSGEDSGHTRDRDFSSHEFNDNQRRYPSKMMPEGPNTSPANPAQKYMLQQHLGVDRSRSPNPPGLGSESGGGGGGGGNGGIGETPSSTSTSRSRIGRNRTDTMVFSDAEASAVADELAAKARAGELEADYEHDANAPKTARPAEQSEVEAEKDQEGEGEGEDDEPDLDGETQFEISLSPEEEIHTYVDIKGIPTHLEPGEEAHVEASGADLVLPGPEPLLERHPAKEDGAEKAVEPTTSTTPPPPAEAEPKVEEKAVEPIPSEEEKAQPADEKSASEQEPADMQPTPTPATVPIPDEVKEVPPEAETIHAEPPAETAAPAPAPPVAEETAAPVPTTVKWEVVDPVVSSTTPPPPDATPSASEQHEHEPTPAPAAAPPTEPEPAAEPMTHDTDTPSHPVEAAVSEPTKPEETVPPSHEHATAVADMPDVAESAVEAVKEEVPAPPEVAPAVKEPEAAVAAVEPHAS